MEILPLKDIPYFSRLGQNIYRHDGLLALPRGIVLRDRELEEIKHYDIPYVLVYDKTMSIGDEQDISFTLNIIESAYTKTTLWDSDFGEQIYDYIHSEILDNNRLGQILNELRIADSYSFAHCINISIVVTSLLRGNILDLELLGKMSFIALLHDVGRLKMVGIFSKKGKLTPKEFDLVRRHPEESYKMLKKAGFLESEIAFVIETHEKYNGTGYPYNLRGNEISDLSQLILIADVYNALSSFRPHRDSYSPHMVSQMIEDEKGKAFNVDVVNLFKQKFTPYRKGMLVLLKDGRTARIKSTHYSKTLPLIEILDEDTAEVLQTIDLSSNERYQIKRIAEI